MSKLLTVLYEVAEIRAGCQRVHDDRFGLSPRNVLRAIVGRQPVVSSANGAELRRLQEQLTEARLQLDELTAEDLAIRSGHEINAVLRDYIETLGHALEALEGLCGQEARNPSLPGGDDSAPLKIVYDDALQHQKQLAGRLNALVAAL